MKRKVAIMKKTNYCCAYCGIGFDEAEFTIDHIVPRSKGGSNKDHNLLAACRSCNTSKNTSDLDVFRWRMSFNSSDLKGEIPFHSYKRCVELGLFVCQVPEHKFYYEQIGLEL